MLRLITLGRLQLERDGPPNEPIHLQPKRLALLAVLALAAGDGCQQRDTLLALFWPRSDREHSRRCLRQALFHLRNELGDGVIVNRGRDGVALAPDRLWCDTAAVEAALQGRRRREALDLYAGDCARRSRRAPGSWWTRRSGTSGSRRRWRWPIGRAACRPMTSTAFAATWRCLPAPATRRPRWEPTPTSAGGSAESTTRSPARNPWR